MGSFCGGGSVNVPKVAAVPVILRNPKLPEMSQVLPELKRIQ